MGLIDGLISEVFADFKDSVEAANNELFKVKFRGDSHVKFHVEVVVVGDKGSGSGATGNHVHHGGFDFEEF